MTPLLELTGDKSGRFLESFLRGEQGGGAGKTTGHCAYHRSVSPNQWGKPPDTDAQSMNTYMK